MKDQLLQIRDLAQVMIAEEVVGVVVTGEAQVVGVVEVVGITMVMQMVQLV